MFTLLAFGSLILVGSQPQYPEDAQAVLWRESHGNEPRPPVTSQHHPARYVSGPPWKWAHQPQSSLWVTAAWTDSLIVTL